MNKEQLLKSIKERHIPKIGTRVHFKIVNPWSKFPMTLKGKVKETSKTYGCIVIEKGAIAQDEFIIKPSSIL